MADKVKVKFNNGSVAELTETEVARLRELGKQFTILTVDKPPKPISYAKKAKQGEGGDD